MSREKRHDTPGSGNYHPNKRCGGILRRLYARDDTGGKTKYERTDFFICLRCGKVVSRTMPDSEV